MGRGLASRLSKIADQGNKNTAIFFEADDFADHCPLLCEIKKKNNITVSVILPTLNVEKTLEPILIQLKSLVTLTLIDEIKVIDGESTDSTMEICKKQNIEAIVAKSAPPGYHDISGKGVQLWKSVFLSSSDIICWIDSDIIEYNNRFVIGLIGPLLLSKHIHFTKAFYKRPLVSQDKAVDINGGGRVTELCFRPWANLCYPGLAEVIQPLSGEYAFKRHVIEDLKFSSNFGVETILLIDFYKKYGLTSFAQVNMQKRIHHNKNVSELSKTSFMISQVFLYFLQRESQTKITPSHTLNVLDKHQDQRKSTKIKDLFTPFRHEEIILSEVRSEKLKSLDVCNLFFVRHGETEQNDQNIIQGQGESRLNENGKEQATLLREQIRRLNVSFDNVYSSDLQRCRETHAIIEATNTLPSARFEPMLRERDYGQWTMKSKSDLAYEFTLPTEFSWSKLTTYDIPEAETALDFQLRVVDFIKSIINNSGNVLVITHCGVLNAIYRHTKQLAISADIPDLSWKNAGIYKLTVEPNDLLYHCWDMHM